MVPLWKYLGIKLHYSNQLVPHCILIGSPAHSRCITHSRTGHKESLTMKTTAAAGLVQLLELQKRERHKPQKGTVNLHKT